MKKVKIYSTPTCTYCVMAKDWFGENGVEYEEVDVSANETARNELVEKTGQMGVPVIEIGEGAETETIIGFDKEKLTGLLDVK